MRSRAAKGVFFLWLLVAMAAVSAAQQTQAETPGTSSSTPSSTPAGTGPGNVSVPPPPNLRMAPESPANDLPILIAPQAPLPPPIGDNVRPLNLRSASEVIKVVLGLVFLFGLAYVAGTSWMHAFENKLQITNVVTAGLPFVLLGAIAHTRGIGILSESVLWQLRPVLALGLGWIGFAAGFRFDSKLGESIMPGITRVSLLTASVPFVTIVAVCGLLLVFVEHSPANIDFLRDALMLGTAGAMTAYNAARLLERGFGDRVATIITLEQLAGFIGLLIVAAYFRPQDNSVAWHLPGTAWLFITIGMGTMVGGVIWATLFKVKAGPEFTVLILGSVCFTAGMASFLRISPLVVCFLVGLILVNLPGTSKREIREVLEHMERPIYLLFLLVAGSFWDVTQWQGWALMLLFVPARLMGKWLAIGMSRRAIPGGLSYDENRTLIFSPMGALSIAIVVNAQDLYYGGPISWIVTAVVGGAIVTEVIVQMASRGKLFEKQQFSSI